jgi:predicted RNase H-like HicB family nuclease
MAESGIYTRDYAAGKDNGGMTRRVILYPGEDGYVVAEVPSLPGCISQGRTRDEALANIQEAIALHVEVLQELGEPVPDDRVEVVEVAA